MMEAGVVINVPKVTTITFPADNSESFTYDLNANLLTISRKGKDDAGSYRVVDENIYHVPTGKMIRFYGDGFTANQLLGTKSKINTLNK